MLSAHTLLLPRSSPREENRSSSREKISLFTRANTSAATSTSPTQTEKEIHIRFLSPFGSTASVAIKHTTRKGASAINAARDAVRYPAAMCKNAANTSGKVNFLCFKAR